MKYDHRLAARQQRAATHVISAMSERRFLRVSFASRADTFFDDDNKPVQERGAASVILEHAGFEVTDLKPVADDPPDCAESVRLARAM